MQLVSMRSELEVQDYNTEQKLRRDPTIYEITCKSCHKKYCVTNSDLLDDPTCSCPRCGNPHH